MKKIKYIFSAILIFILLSFIGELYVWNLMEFSFNYNSIETPLPANVIEQYFIDNIVKLADANNVDVFLIEKNIDNIFSETIRIFGTHGIETSLHESSQITSGTHSSTTLGNVAIYFYDLENLDAIPTVGFYRLVGNNDNQRTFFQHLANIYDDVTFFEGNSSNEIAWVFSAIWLVVIVLLLLMTLFDVALMKKEVMIRLVSGERGRDFVARCIVQDLIFYILTFISLYLMLRSFSHTSYLIHVTVNVILF